MNFCITLCAMKRFAIVVLLLMVSLLLGFLLGRGVTKRAGNTTAIEDGDWLSAGPDTTTEFVEHDTTFVDRPVPYISRELKDSLRILVALNNMQAQVIDSLIDEIGNPPMDTIIEIDVPRWQEEYKDSTYHAWVSGYEPALDSIQVYSKTVYQTITIREYQPKKKWAVGIQAGMGVGLNDNKVITTPYIGVGLTYKLFEF